MFNELEFTQLHASITEQEIAAKDRHLRNEQKKIIIKRKLEMLVIQSTDLVAKHQFTFRG